jgi:hypothetical protein
MQGKLVNYLYNWSFFALENTGKMNEFLLVSVKKVIGIAY